MLKKMLLKKQGEIILQRFLYSVSSGVWNHTISEKEITGKLYSLFFHTVKEILKVKVVKQGRSYKEIK